MLFPVISAKNKIKYLQAVGNYPDSGACPGHNPWFAGVMTSKEAEGL
jgi:hypothetical protein